MSMASKCELTTWTYLPCTSIPWFCKLTWCIKYFIFLLGLDQWLQNVARCWVTMKGFNPQIHIALLSCFPLKPSGKLKTYVYYCNSYCMTPFRVVTFWEKLPPVNLLHPKVVMWGHVTNWMHNISTCRHHTRIPHLKSHEVLFKWPACGHVTV